MSSSLSPIGGGFTEGELEAASFWVRHGIMIRRVGFGLLVGLNVILWMYVLWGMLDAFAISYPRESRITTEIATNQVTLATLQQDQPQPIASDPVAVFQGTDKRYDMEVDLRNPNDQWWVEFNYRFNLSGEQTPLRNGFIMPGKSTTLTELGYRPKGPGGADAQFVVDNIRWHRVDPNQVGPRYADFENARFNVAFQNVTYQNSLVIGSRTVGRTSFDIVNRGAYGYWSMDLVVKVYRGTSQIAVNQINVQKLNPGETRHIDMDWYDSLPSVTRTEIIPVFNFLDPSAYLPTTQFTTP